MPVIVSPVLLELLLNGLIAKTHTAAAHKQVALPGAQWPDTDGGARTVVRSPNGERGQRTAADDAGRHQQIRRNRSA